MSDKLMSEGPYSCATCGPFDVCSCERVRVRRPVAVPPAVDMVNHPPHYQKPWGEVIDITEGMNFCLGNVIKYVLRHEDKGGLEDLKKARFYLDREINRLSSE